MDEKTRKQIELATVRVRSKGMNPGEGGQGVYIGNGFVLTAAHCLKFDTDGGIAQGDYVIYYIDRPEGEPIWCSPVCCLARIVARAKVCCPFGDGGLFLDVADMTSKPSIESHAQNTYRCREKYRNSASRIRGLATIPP